MLSIGIAAREGDERQQFVLFIALEGARTTATLVRTEMASHARVTGGICVNQASKPTGIDTVGAAAAESLRLIDDATGPAPRGPTNVSQEQRSGNTPGRRAPHHYCIPPASVFQKFSLSFRLPGLARAVHTNAEIQMQKFSLSSTRPACRTRSPARA